MEMILLIENVGEPRKLANNQSDYAADRYVVTIEANSASGHLQVDAFTPICEALKDQGVGVGSVIVADIDFKVRDVNTKDGNKFRRTDMTMTHFITTDKAF